MAKVKAAAIHKYLFPGVPVAEFRKELDGLSPEEKLELGELAEKALEEEKPKEPEPEPD